MHKRPFEQLWILPLLPATSPNTKVTAQQNGKEVAVSSGLGLPEHGVL